MGCSLQQREVSKSAAGDGVEAQGGYYSKAASMSAVCLTKHLVTVKNCLALFLDLLFPALLCSLNPLQHCVSFGLGTVHRGTHLLRVLLVVQWLGVGVMFANKRIDQQKEQHVEQQSTHHRQVNDDGYLDGVAASFLVLALTQQAVRLHVMARHRHGLHYMEAVTILLRHISVIYVASDVPVWRADALATDILKVLGLNISNSIQQEEGQYCGHHEGAAPSPAGPHLLPAADHLQQLL